MPLEPVAPLPAPFAPVPEPVPEQGGSSPWMLVGIAAVVLLGINAVIGWNLLRTQQRQEARLARLEAAAFTGGAGPKADDGLPSTGHLPRAASPETRLAALLAVAGDTDRSRRLLDSLSPEQCEMLGRTLISRAAASDRNAALTAVVNYLAANDPQRAAGLLDAVQEPVLRSALARGVADTWTASHPDDAARWLASAGSRFLTPTAASAPLVRAITQWSSFDPADAARFAASLPLDRGPVARSLFLASRAWGQLDPTAALAWVGSLPASDPRHDQASQGAWEGWTEHDPAGAGVALRQQLYGATNRPPVDLAGTVGRQWAQTDPAGAAQWALTLPGGAVRGEPRWRRWRRPGRRRTCPEPHAGRPLCPPARAGRRSGARSSTVGRPVTRKPPGPGWEGCRSGGITTGPWRLICPKLNRASRRKRWPGRRPSAIQTRGPNRYNGCSARGSGATRGPRATGQRRTPWRFCRRGGRGRSLQRFSYGCMVLEKSEPLRG